jgi:hydroxyacylglutathione hydrolase
LTEFMEIEKLVVGQLRTNCYLVWDEKAGEGIVIDPGDDGDYILRRLQDLEIKPKLIIATHGHFDHILAATELKLALEVPFLIHRADLPLLKKTKQSAKYWLGVEVDPPPLDVDRFIKEGDKIKFGQETLEVIESPGHSPGGIALYSNKRKILFSGDTLFKRGVGRTDLSYSSSKDLAESLEKLFNLPPETVVYPGHGPETTIGEEKTLNPSF